MTRTWICSGMNLNWQGAKKYLKARSAEPKLLWPSCCSSVYTLVIWRLDRLSRSLKDLIEMVKSLESNSVGLKSLQESIDTTSSSGMLIFHLFGALAEFERNLPRERTHASLEVARARGRKGGRPEMLSKDKQALAGQRKIAYGYTDMRINGSIETTLYKYIDAAKKYYFN